MKNQLVLSIAAVVLTIAPVTLQAQPYYVAGSFNGWDSSANSMTDDSDGSYSLTTSGHSVGGVHEWLVIESPSFDPKYPGSNAKGQYSTNGGFTFHFFPGLQLDGWDPLQNRVGYDDPGVSGWEVMGSWNGFSSPVVTLTNMGSGLYEGAYVVATPGTYEYKFRQIGTWAGAQVGIGFGTADNISMTTTTPDQSVTFRLDLPNGRYVAGDPASATTNKVTFVVDMSVPISTFAPPSYGFLTNGDSLYVRGSWNSFATQPAYELFPIAPGSATYSNTVDVVGYVGSTIQYKFFGDVGPGSENPLLSCGGDRSLVLSSTNVTAPAAAWDDRTLNGNTVTFQVDMALQVAFGSFDPNTEGVYVRGNFNNWGGTPATEPPLALAPLSAPNTNIYAGTLTNVPVGACLKYKFWKGTDATTGDFEAGSDRESTLAGTSNVLAVVPYSGVEACDVIEATNYVTFTVSMTNAIGIDDTVYDGTQNVYLNGNFVANGNFGPWNDTNGVATNFLMSQIGGTSNYTITVPMPPGVGLRMVYKYSMNGADNEAGFETDHVRYIRTPPGQTNYVLPLDVWTGTNATNIANLVEPKFGNLTATPGAPGQLDINWHGLKCVQLQGATSLVSPVWNNYLGTDGTSSTNVPTSGSQQYFRLIDLNP